MLMRDIQRLLLGTFVRPAKETDTGAPRVEAVYGYLVRDDRSLILFDTGLGRGAAETENWYRPRRVAPPDALGKVGVTWSGIDMVRDRHGHQLPRRGPDSPQHPGDPHARPC